MPTPGIKAAAIPGTVRTMRETTARDHVDFDPGDGTMQPIMMVTTAISKSGARWTGNNKRRTADGKIERLPSVAHTNHDFRNLEVHEPSRRRFKTMLDIDGHVVSVVHSNAAAHAPKIEAGGKFSRDGYAQYVVDKSYGIGRIDMDGGCLIRQLKADTVNPRTIVARELVGPKAKVCKADATCCPHMAIERDQRRAKNDERMAALEERYAAPSEARDARIAIAVAKALGAQVAK